MSSGPFCLTGTVMSSRAPPHLAFEGEPVHKGSLRYSVPLWSPGRTPWPFTLETLSSAGSSQWSCRGQGPSVAEGLPTASRNPVEAR